MKKLLIIAFFSIISFAVNAQTKTPTKITNKEVEIACGECQFKMSHKDANGKSKGCDLAIRIDGKPYFVDGKGIDDFGDAHDEHGFCNAISKAKVTGEIVNGRFKAEKIELLPKQ